MRGEMKVCHWKHINDNFQMCSNELNRKCQKYATFFINTFLIIVYFSTELLTTSFVVFLANKGAIDFWNHIRLLEERLTNFEQLYASLLEEEEEMYQQHEEIDSKDFIEYL